ncbi:hypothetical protein Ciccas_010530, partial [Cichlidogyrus casuarinus]
LRGFSSSIGIEFVDVLHYYLGRYGSFVGFLFSMLSFVGALIVFFILLTNFLFHTGEFIHEYSQHSHPSMHPIFIHNQTFTDVVCENLPWMPITNASSRSQYMAKLESIDFNVFWDSQRFVPFLIFCLLFPVCTFGNPAFFSRFTAMGVVSLGYILVLILTKAISWGPHFDLYANSTDPYSYVPEFKPSLYNLTGICALAFFIHNAIHTIMKRQKNPKNNSRDLAIAFILVGLTYLLIGTIFFVGFPLPKSCLKD